MMNNEEFERFLHMECTAKSNEIKAQRWQERAQELEKEIELLKGEQRNG